MNFEYFNKRVDTIQVKLSIFIKKGDKYEKF